MMRGRREERRDDRQEDRGPGPGPVGGGPEHYRMAQRLASIGDDYWIENERGVKVFKIDGKALRVRQTLIFEDAHGREQARIQERMLRVKDSMEIEGPGGRRLAMLKKAIIDPIRERWTAHVEGGPDIDIQGNFVDHEYHMEANGRKIAEVSKRWFRIRDTYGVEIDAGQNDVLILAIAVAMDEMAHPGR